MNLQAMFLFGAALVLGACSKGSEPGINAEPQGDVVGGASDAQTAGDAPLASDTAPLDDSHLSADVASDASAAACPPSLHGPKLVMLPAKDGSAYCMDQREVTAGEYAEFLKAKNGDMSGQIQGCEWNETWMGPLAAAGTEESVKPGYCLDQGFDPVKYPDRAVACTDWCDAYAYCAWAGKRLCGKIGGGAGALDAMNDPGKSEWANACTQGGATKYPWGDTYVPGQCIDQTAIKQGGASSMDVKDGSTSQCHGALADFAGIFDLVGSVQEWTNECQSPGASCALHGFGSMHADTVLSCDAGGGFAGTTHWEIGFRCCADMPP